MHCKYLEGAYTSNMVIKTTSSPIVHSHKTTVTHTGHTLMAQDAPEQNMATCTDSHRGDRSARELVGEVPHHHVHVSPFAKVKTPIIVAARTPSLSHKGVGESAHVPAKKRADG